LTGSFSKLADEFPKRNADRWRSLPLGFGGLVVVAYEMFWDDFREEKKGEVPAEEFVGDWWWTLGSC